MNSMVHKKQHIGSQGFTLIGLLVVIAIIGILSAVVLASLSNSRGKARIAAAQSTMHSIQAGAVTCLLDGDVDLPTTQTQGGGGLGICSSTGASTYANLPSGWVYCIATLTTPCTAASSITGAAPNVTAFMIRAYGDGKLISCQESGCITS